MKKHTRTSYGINQFAILTGLGLMMIVFGSGCEHFRVPEPVSEETTPSETEVIETEDYTAEIPESWKYRLTGGGNDLIMDPISVDPPGVATEPLYTMRAYSIDTTSENFIAGLQSGRDEVLSINEDFKTNNNLAGYELIVFSDYDNQESIYVILPLSESSILIIYANAEPYSDELYSFVDSIELKGVE